LNLPNLITIARIILAMVLVPLLFIDNFTARIVAFVIFLVAAVSDLWDGYLARSQGMITDLGKLLDPLADKLLLAATFVPFYILAQRPGPDGYFPFFGGTLPLWVLIVIFGRELLITVFRSYAARKGVVIAAGTAGKYKTVVQNVFAGAAILWFALQSAARARGWEALPSWHLWERIHWSFGTVTLSIALILTIYSMIVYLWGNRSVLRGRTPA
jgi:CDP-diacylglycerol---glycerol-3-phosphate 3-phosphatidyltransferase